MDFPVTGALQGIKDLPGSRCCARKKGGRDRGVLARLEVACAFVLPVVGKGIFLRLYIIGITACQ
jgi:hypothetical protein